jgi:hypothetical protein
LWFAFAARRDIRLLLHCFLVTIFASSELPLLDRRMNFPRDAFGGGEHRSLAQDADQMFSWNMVF